MHKLTTRARAEAYLAARSYSGQAQLTAFLAAQPRVLPTGLWPAPPRPAARHRRAETGFLLCLAVLLLVLAALKH